MSPKRRISTAVAMTLVGPALVVLAGIVYQHVPEAVFVGLQLAGWLGGPVLMVWGVVRLLREVPVRYCTLMAVSAIPLFVASVLLHGLIAGLTGTEEPVFFVLAIIVAPVMLIGGILGAVIPRHQPPGGLSATTS